MNLNVIKSTSQGGGAEQTPTPHPSLSPLENGPWQQVMTNR